MAIQKFIWHAIWFAPNLGRALTNREPTANRPLYQALWLKHPAVGPSSPEVASLTATSAARSTVKYPLPFRLGAVR